jgi:hypothetical protein
MTLPLTTGRRKSILYCCHSPSSQGGTLPKPLPYMAGLLFPPKILLVQADNPLLMCVRTYPGAKVLTVIPLSTRSANIFLVKWCAAAFDTLYACGGTSCGRMPAKILMLIAHLGSSTNGLSPLIVQRRRPPTAALARTPL